MVARLLNSHSPHLKSDFRAKIYCCKLKRTDYPLCNFFQQLDSREATTANFTVMEKAQSLAKSRLFDILLIFKKLVFELRKLIVHPT